MELPSKTRLLKERRGKDMLWEDEEEDVSSYCCLTLRERLYWKLKEEALDRILWGARFGRGYGLVVRQTTE
jgi:hypothetical protein